MTHQSGCFGCLGPRHPYAHAVSRWAHRRLGIDEVRGGIGPKDNADLVQRSQAEGREGPLPPADTFANFPCEGLDRRTALCVPISGNEHMSSASKLSLLARLTVNARSTALAGASLGLVPAATVLAAEPPVSVEYHSAFADYRHFDAQALAVEWRHANDLIRDGAEDASHGMHDMRTPMKAPWTMGDKPSPATPDEHQAHQQ